MPSGSKSNKYMNRHALEAREREQERKLNAKATRAKELEDAMWAESDSKVLKKQAKQREAEEKERRQAAARAEKKELLEKEEQELVERVPQKVTRRQIQKDLLKMFTDYDKEKNRERGQKQGVVDGCGSNATTVDAIPLPEGNPNRNRKSDNSSNNNISASGGVNEALSALQLGMSANVSVVEDRHIGKRARVLYKKFYDEQLPLVREERPGLRLTQYSDLIWEKWQKNPANPFVQRSEQRSKERIERERRWLEGDDEENEDLLDE